MKSTTVTCLLATLLSAKSVLASSPESADPDHEILVADLKARQAAGQVAAGATLAATQAAIATTQWFESTNAITTTWVEVPYTQTFAVVPDQLPSAGSGEIGYGTLTKKGGKSKRDVVAQETGPLSSFSWAQPVQLEMRYVTVTQYIQPVQEIVVLEHVILASNITIAGLPPYSNSTIGNGTLANGTAPSNGTNSTLQSYDGTFFNLTHNGSAPIGATGAAINKFSAFRHDRGFFF